MLGAGCYRSMTVRTYQKIISEYLNFWVFDL